MWADPMPDEDQLARLYDGSYFERRNGGPDDGHLFVGYHDYVGLRFLKQMDHQRVARSLMDMAPTRRPRLLDIGCAMGHFMDAAQDCGFDVEGIDRNADAISKLSAKYCFPATCTELADFNGGPYDTVTMLDVVEHLKDPWESIAKAASLVPKGGVMAISTPDMGSLPARLLGARNELIQKAESGEHLTFFTRRTLTAALHRVGFDVVRIDSYGLTTDFATAAKRVGAALPAVGAIAHAAVKALKLSRAFVHFNHRLNMIAYAKKRNGLAEPKRFRHARIDPLC